MGRPHLQLVASRYEELDVIKAGPKLAEGVVVIPIVAEKTKHETRGAVVKAHLLNPAVDASCSLATINPSTAPYQMALATGSRTVRINPILPVIAGTAEVSRTWVPDRA
jgi:hypothetical protein